jgi:4-oxalocrotonate tautomerase
MLRCLKVETVQEQETTMPLVQVHTIKGVFTPEMKKNVIEKVTDAMVAVEGENLRGVTCVTINEVDSGDWGIGGRALTAEYVKALAAGKAAA